MYTLCARGSLVRIHHLYKPPPSLSPPLLLMVEGPQTASPLTPLTHPLRQLNPPPFLPPPKIQTRSTTSSIGMLPLTSHKRSARRPHSHPSHHITPHHENDRPPLFLTFFSLQAIYMVSGRSTTTPPSNVSRTHCITNTTPQNRQYHLSTQHNPHVALCPSAARLELVVVAARDNHIVDLHTNVSLEARMQRSDMGAEARRLGTGR